MKKYDYALTASLICSDPLDLRKSIEDIELAGIEYIHFDVMDGVFVPRYGLFPEMLSAIKKITNIPVDVHMMVINAEQYVSDFAKAGADILYVHVENNNHLHRTIRLIKNNGMKAGIVFNIGTPINVLDYILDDVDYIMLMGINPGIVGHKIIPKVYDKIKEVKEKIKDYPNIKIMVDGGVTPDTAPEMIKNGADIIVCGSSSIYRPGEGTLAETTKRFREKVDSKLEE